MTVSVMMVDDSSVTLLVMTYILQRDENITICGTAPDGESALILAEKCKPDIITMDLNMPGLNGLEVTRRMLAKRLVPIIIVTTDKTSAANLFYFGGWSRSGSAHSGATRTSGARTNGFATDPND